MVWQVLDVGSIWMKEFASALRGVEPMLAWQPKMLATGLLPRTHCEQRLSDPPLEYLEFPLQKGYARKSVRWAFSFERGLLQRLLADCADPQRSPLVCSTPFYAPVAELWPGPVIYYSTDLTAAYDGMDFADVLQFERRLCRVATLVCPNSRRIADHLVAAAGCDARKVTIVPNATRLSNVSCKPRFGPTALPGDVADLPRPVVGILGDLSGNMDWELIAAAMRLTPGLSWLFVGPTSRAVPDAKQAEARQWAMQHGRFTGAKPYGELQAYARACDVAILPYRKREPTYSGSSTRFYEHLCALRPMIATRGFAELLEKEPLLQLIDTPEELAEALRRLEAQGFQDGCEEARWRQSRKETWEERARTMVDALRSRAA